MTRFQPPRQQGGAVLFIALVMLLVITLLALSNTREVTLESRITGNFVEQQRLLNAGESGLREGESRMTSGVKPLNAACVSGAAYCMKTDNSYAQDFNTSHSYSPNDGAQTRSDTRVRWYAAPASSGAASGESENPEYGNMMRGIGTFRYEINSEATNTSSGQSVRLRSTTAQVFN